jgi:hypothetical protein
VRRTSTGAIAAVIAIVLVSLSACGPMPAVPPSSDGPVRSSLPSGPQGPPPAPGHEVYGFVPYWEMDDGIAAHLEQTALTTLALFSVTNTSKGAIKESENGFRRITGPVGTRLIQEAHARGTRVELVFTSFGRERNRRFFERPELQDATIESLVAFAGGLGVDGLNVDVEGLDPGLIPAFGAFVGRLRAAVVAADAQGEVSVSTAANATGAAMAAAAVAAGADRVFLMGYDYRTARSSPGATSPLDREDGNPRTLRWSLDLYAALGVPVERTLLGLPLYGMTWQLAGPAIGDPAIGRGSPWIPRRNKATLADPSTLAVRDDVEAVDVYILEIGQEGAGPTPGPAPTEGSIDRAWRAVYVDSPATLARKLALANERGLAGGGFWAIGYERGLPAYTDLMRRFAAGEPVG